MNRKIFDLDILYNYVLQITTEKIKGLMNIQIIFTVSNCGKEGHTYRRCRLPITICGVILIFKK